MLLKSRLLLLWCLCFLLSRSVSAHPGGLSAQGCHTDNRGGNYHCHRGLLAGQSFRSRAEAEKALSTEGERASNSPAVSSTGPSTPPTTPSYGVIAPEASTQTYVRQLYHHWTDADGDCQDTRQEVLIRQSLVSVTLSPDGCRVLGGLWHDSYTGEQFTDPAALDIDHWVPLREAHVSGAWAWSAEQRERFANDLSINTLSAVSASANRSKSDRDPARWLPPNQAFRCEYVLIWLSIKTRYQLKFDRSEMDAISETLRTC
jgi:hypothetical protein